MARHPPKPIKGVLDPLAQHTIVWMTQTLARQEDDMQENTMFKHCVQDEATHHCARILSGQRAAALLRVAIPKHAQVPNDYRPYVSTDRGLGWTMSSANFAPFIGCQLLTAGWPFRALCGEAWIDANGLRVANALLARSVTTGPSLIPVRPIWPGFLLNSAFYGMLGWFCAQRFASVRQSRRINRRLCPGCAYPMGESSVCSECGRELRVRHATLPSSTPDPPPRPLPKREGGTSCPFYTLGVSVPSVLH